MAFVIYNCLKTKSTQGEFVHALTAFGNTSVIFCSFFSTNRLIQGVLATNLQISFPINETFQDTVH